MTVSTVQTNQAGWRFWELWMLAGTAAAVVFLLAMVPLNAIAVVLRPATPELGEPSGYEPALRALLLFSSVALLGALVGVGQWWVLRRHVPACGGWVAAAAVGYGLPLLLGPAGLLPDLTPWFGIAELVLAFTLILGGLESLVLRGRVHQPGVWILITLLGWTLAFVLTRAATLTGLYVEPLDMFLAYFVPIAVAGAGMVWLLRRTARAGGLDRQAN